MKRVFAGVAVALTITGAAVILNRFWLWPASMAVAADDGTELQATTAAEFPEKVVWAQGDPLKLSELKGRVTVVQFWTHGCINCIHNYPVYKSWQEKYDARKLTIIGVHTPEFDREKPAEQVRAAARTNGLKFPIVLDNDKLIWNAWGNRYWPSIYLVDKKGQVRYRWEGELHLDTAEGKAFARHIDELLSEGTLGQQPRGK